ncbi:uncharacterized protein LOC111087199, partial [Limulus polyphemus]|uniref:Uncharacterized protein LOC111087199 n=1 Tax=Limulus polyphemus TaxID=6850 RepID=A0ABM1SYP4_LIMPO
PKILHGVKPEVCLIVFDPPGTGNLKVSLHEIPSGTVLAETFDVITPDGGLLLSCSHLPVNNVNVKLAELQVQVDFPSNPHFEINEKREVQISSAGVLTFIETDKSNYSPGEKVLGVAGSEEDVATLQKDMEHLMNVQVEDPEGTKIVEWLNVTTRKAPTKFYVVASPPPYVLADTDHFTWKICAKHTYGQNVEGTLKAFVTYVPFSKEKSINLPFLNHEGNINGCFDLVIQEEILKWKTEKYFFQTIILKATVIEKQTYVMQSITEELNLVVVPIELTFPNVDLHSPHFHLSLPYFGKIDVKKPDGKPAPAEIIEICYEAYQRFDMSAPKHCKNFSSELDGSVEFVIPAQPNFIQGIYVEAVATKYPNVDSRGKRVLYQPMESLYLTPWYSPSGSFLEIVPIHRIPECQDKLKFDVIYTTDTIEQAPVMFVQDAGFLVMADLTLETKPCISSDEFSYLVGKRNSYNNRHKSAMENLNTHFFKTLLWDLVQVNGKTEIHHNVPKETTKWSANAVCLSDISGIGISEFVSAEVHKPFYLGLTTPYSIVSGESVELKSFVYNYLPDCLPLTLVLTSEYSEQLKAQGKTTQSICVCGNESKTVNFKVKGQTPGKAIVSVKALSNKDKSQCDKTSVSDKHFEDIVSRNIQIETNVESFNIDEPIPSFNIKISGVDTGLGQCEKRHLTLCLSRTNTTASPSMVVADIKMPSGFVPDYKSLNELVVNRNSSLYTFKGKDNHVEMLLGEIQARSTCFSFAIIQEIKVTGLKEAVVNVYNKNDKGVPVSCPICQSSFHSSIYYKLNYFKYVLVGEILYKPRDDDGSLCGSFSIIKFLKGNKKYFKREVHFRVKNNCGCNPIQHTRGKFILITTSKVWIKENYLFTSLMLSQDVYVINYNNLDDMKNALIESNHLSKSPDAPSSCPNCLSSIDNQLQDIISSVDSGDQQFAQRSFRTCTQKYGYIERANRISEGGRIVGCHLGKMSVCAIVQQLNIPRSTFGNVLKKWKSTCDIEPKKRPVLKIEIQRNPTEDKEKLSGSFVVIDKYTRLQDDYGYPVIFSAKRDCYCDNLTPGTFLLFAGNDAWTEMNFKMQMTDQVYIVAYSSTNEHEVQEKLGSVNDNHNQRIAPNLYMDCSSKPFICPKCQSSIDYHLGKIICAFDIILKIDIKTLAGAGDEDTCGQFVVTKLLKGTEYDIAYNIRYNVKKGCYCDQLKVGPYILLSMKVPWIKTTNQVYLINYNSGNEYKIEKKLQYCDSYLPPESYPQKSYPYRPLTYCPSVPYFCPICQLHIDYKVEGIICTFDFILKIDIKSLPSSAYGYSCGKFVIIKFYKGNKYHFESEIYYNVKKNCYCDQLKVGLFILLSVSDHWSKVSYKYGAVKLTDLQLKIN